MNLTRKTIRKLIIEALSEDRHSPLKHDLHDAKVGNTPIKIQVCDELEDRKKGLMFRHSMPKDEGMLFIHDAPVEASYYMKNTYIPLTIAFADEDGVIFQMEDMSPEDLTSKVSIQPALYALEMNQGWFDRNGIVIGDNIDF